METRPKAWVVLAAAGSGVRFGGPLPKQFLVAGGQTLAQTTIRNLWNHPEIEGMVVVVPADTVSREVLPAELAGHDDILVVAGGRRRCDSVREGYKRLPDRCKLVLVHDAVRPCISPGLVSRVIAGAWRDGACIPVVPVHDTVKEMGAGDRVGRTVDRERLRLSQTPQGFRREILEQAYAWADRQGSQADFPDSAALVEASGGEVSTVEGEPGNLKVTVPADLGRLGMLLPRVGYGYDAHRLAEGRKLMLGGVEVEYHRGLVGHSDGDCLLHALCDAVLGAAGLGDIGRYFPDDDPKYQGADSLDLLREIVDHCRRAGWRVSSVDVTVVAQEPRLAGILPEMVSGIARVLGVQPGAVGIKATTEEGMGFTGSGQGIAAHAVAVLAPRI